MVRQQMVTFQNLCLDSSSSVLSYAQKCKKNRTYFPAVVQFSHNFSTPKSNRDPTTIEISVNVRDRMGLFESFLFLNRLRYVNMNGTMLSQILWVMFLPQQVYQK